MGVIFGKNLYTKPHVDVAVISASTAAITGVLAWKASALGNADKIVEMSKVALGNFVRYINVFYL